MAAPGTPPCSPAAADTAVPNVLISSTRSLTRALESRLLADADVR